MKKKMATVDVEACLDENSLPPRKKARFENENINCLKPCATVHDTIGDLTDFKLEKVLQSNTTRKTVCLQGRFGDNNEKAIVFLEKTAFIEEDFVQSSDYFSDKSSLLKVFHNDVYGNYKFFPAKELNSLKATIIHPATDKHIEKYSPQNSYILDESPNIYKDIVLPHTNVEQLNLQWVYNILEHKSEADRIVFEETDPDTGFVLIPDLKWDGSIDTLYLLAIVQRHDIKSLRDLTSNHLPLLRNVKEKGIQAIKEKFGLDGNQLRIYFHYHPSFYHLHIHFTYLRYEAPGILAERAHLLSNVISNIEICSDYYQKVTLPLVVFENSKLFKKLEEACILKKCVATNTG